METHATVSKLVVPLLFDALDVQYSRRFGPDLLAKGSILGKILAERGYHFLQFGGPSSGLQFFRVAALDDLKHNPHSSRGTRRSPQHGNDGLVGCVDKLRAELQEAAMLRVLFDDLYTLACHFHSPIFLLGLRKVLAERSEPRFRSLEHLADQ